MQHTHFHDYGCRTCPALLCPYAQVDFINKLWVCPFCFQRNHFPQHYHHMAQNNLPPELFPHYSTVEYAPPADKSLPPVFLFVLDTCLIEEELGFLKTALKQAIELLPEHALVGMITFGTQIQVHELGSAELPKSYIFRGSKDISKEAILEQLGLSPSGRSFQLKGQQPNGVHGGTFVSGVNRFLLPQAECEYTLGAVRTLISLCICRLMNKLVRLRNWNSMAQHNVNYFAYDSYWRICKGMLGPFSQCIGL